MITMLTCFSLRSARFVRSSASNSPVPSSRDWFIGRQDGAQSGGGSADRTPSQKKPPERSVVMLSGESA